MKNSHKLSQMQFISIGSCFLMGTIVISVFISSVTQRESWLVGSLAAIAFLPVLLVYFSLMNKYPKKNLFEINNLALGPVFGPALSALYLVFFLSLCALNVLEASGFLHYFIMPETPVFAVALFIMTACVYCAKKGLGALARVSSIFGIFALVGLLFNIALSVPHSKIEYLFPIGSLQLLDYIQGVHIAAAIPYGETLALLMLVGDTSEKTNAKKAYLVICAFTAVLMTLVHLRDVTSLGPVISLVAAPSFEAVRLIDLANIFSRTESIFALLLVSLTFFKILLLFHICLRGTAQLFSLKSYRPLMLMLAMLLAVYATGAYGSSSNNIFWGKNVSPFVWSTFTFLLPLLTLAAALIREALQKNRKGAPT